MVTIIDRTGEQQEFKHDQRIYAFGADRAGKRKTTMVIPDEVATWLFRDARPSVHTTDGEFVPRYGVVDAPEDWLSEIGPEVLETNALTRDVSRREGWDAEAVDPLRTRARAVDLNTTPNRPRAGDYVNQGVPSGTTGG